MSGGDDERREKRGAGLLTGDYNARKKQKTTDSEKFPKQIAKCQKTVIYSENIIMGIIGRE